MATSPKQNNSTVWKICDFLGGQFDYVPYLKEQYHTRMTVSTYFKILPGALRMVLLVANVKLTNLLNNTHNEHTQGGF